MLGCGRSPAGLTLEVYRHSVAPLLHEVCLLSASESGACAGYGADREMCSWVQEVRKRGIGGPELPPGSALCVTVPGAPALWEDTVKTFGRLDLKQV